MDVYFSFVLATSAEGLQLFNSCPLSTCSRRSQNDESQCQSVPDMQGPFGNVC